MPCVNHPEILDPLLSCTRCARQFCTNCLVELRGGRFCGGCKAEEVKDRQSGVQSGEVPLAGIVPRFAAQMVDGLILGVIWVPLAVAIGLFAVKAPADAAASAGRQLLFQAVVLGIFLAYEAILLQWKGQTLGKMALKLKVVSPDGSPISGAQAWIRAFVRVILSFLWIVDPLPALFTKQKTTLHDLAARTRVVRLGG
jgi:uncharacterized RDD family membrane protein YckC